MQVPGHIGGLLEYRFGQTGRDAIGFTAHVPHYVARSEFPDASSPCWKRSPSTPASRCRPRALIEHAERVREEIDSQVAGSEEVAGVVSALEQQYDAFLSARGRGLLADDTPLPTADELGAEFEAFLRRNS